MSEASENICTQEEGQSLKKDTKSIYIVVPRLCPNCKHFSGKSGDRCYSCTAESNDSSAYKADVSEEKEQKFDDCRCFEFRRLAEFKVRIFRTLENPEEDGKKNKLIEKLEEGDKEKEIIKKQKKAAGKSKAVDKPEEGSKKRIKPHRVLNVVLIVLICLNIVAIIVASVDYVYARYSTFFNIFEIISIVIFTAEYLLRIYTASCPPPKSKSGKSNPYLKFIGSPLAIIDLIAILPFYLSLIFVKIGFGIDLRILRVLRLIRLLRVFKLVRYYRSIQMITKVLKNEKDKLLITVFFMFILILLASSMMYYFENEKNSEMFPNIPTTLWWAVATLTTVGYGDVYPMGIPGRLLGGIIAVLGIGLVAMPSGIIAMGLIQEVRSVPHDPKNILSVLNFLKSKLNDIKDVLDKVKEQLGDEFAISSDQRDENRYGYYFFNGDFFCGWSLDIADEKDGENCVFSLAISKSIMKKNFVIKEEDCPYEDTPFFQDREWVYIPIDIKVFSQKNSTDILRDDIKLIVENVYGKNMDKYDESLKTIKGALEKVEKKLGYEYAIGKVQRDYNGYGYYFNHDNLFFGWNRIAYKGKIFSLAILLKAIKNDFDLTKDDCPYKYNYMDYVYIPVDEKILFDENSAEKLCERIVDIVENVYKKNIK